MKNLYSKAAIFFVCVILVTVIITPAIASFPWSYTWGTAPKDPYPQCGPSATFTNLCTTKEVACSNIQAYYSSPYGNVRLGTATTFGKTYPQWKCDYYYLIPRTIPLRPYCPSGYQTNIFTTRGCVPDQSPKTLGSACSGAIPTLNVAAGNPITICSGNKFQHVTDYQGAGSHDLSFNRYYNSSAEWVGVFGIGWRHGFERSLPLESSTKRMAIRANGQMLEMRKSSGTWKPSDDDVVLQLVESGTNFLLTDENDTIETYDTNGVLQTIESRDGYIQTLTYSSGKLTSVSDNLGRTLAFTYNADGLLDTLTDADGKIYKYTYMLAYPGTTAPEKKLSAITYPDNSSSPTDNPVTTYHYEDTNYPINLTGITDELSHRYATWTYDADGQSTQSTHAGGALNTAITYNSDGTKTVTYPLGEQIKYTFSTIQGAPKVTREDRIAIGTIPAANQQYTYSSKGFLSSKTDWNGTITKYTFSNAGLETSRTEAFGTPKARTITTTWSTAFRLPTQITKPGQTVNFTYDGDGNLLTRTETDTQIQTVPYSTNGTTRSWTYTYDSLGNVLTSDGPRTDVADITTYTYDATTKNLLTVTDALSHLTQITSYNNRGLPLSVIDANGTLTDLTYDTMGRLESRTVNATSGDVVTNYAYNLAGLLTTITFPDATTLSYEYNNAQQLIAVENDSGERIEYTLDAAGNIVTENIKDSGGAIRYKQEQEFDIIGRLSKSIGAIATQDTAYAYDSNGNRVSVIDPRNNTTGFAFDALNRLITVTNPLTHTATTTYDARDNTTSQSDFRTLSTSYIYDGFNRIIQAISPDTGTTIYTLDKAGNVTQETDARSVVTNRTFDALNRALTETFPAYSAENMAYTYDSTASGNEGIGYMTGFTDQSGGTTLRYDDRGDMIQTVRTIGGQAYTTSYTYNSVGQVTQIIYPSGREVNYTYNASGDLITIATKPSSMGGSTTLASSIVHEPFGSVKSFTFGNGLIQTMTHDQNYWLTNILAEDGATHIQDLTIAYDDAGNITGVADAINSGRSQTYTLDSLNRISQAGGAYGTIDYTYDNNSNRLTRVKGGITQTSTYPGGSNKLTSINDGAATRSFTYTAAGNTSADDRAASPDVAYTFGGRNRMASVSVGGSTTGTYLLNARGERVSKVAGGVTTHFHYDEDGQLLGESDGTGATIREYVWLGDLPLAQIEAAGAVYYVHADHLNTPLKMTDATQVLVWERQQEPFGETVATSGTAASSLRFPGQFADPESGLDYNLMRDYDPTLGRYIEADPLGQLGGLNLYGYANQNPALYTDPRGEMAAAASFALRYLAPVGMLNYWYNNIYNPNTANLPEKTPSDAAKKETTVQNDICTATNPDPEDNPNQCQEIIQECRNSCNEIFEVDAELLPGSGSDHFGRLRKCIRKCAEMRGCYNY